MDETNNAEIWRDVVLADVSDFVIKIDDEQGVVLTESLAAKLKEVCAPVHEGNPSISVRDDGNETETWDEQCISEVLSHTQQARFAVSFFALPPIVCAKAMLFSHKIHFRAPNVVSRLFQRYK